MATQPDTISSEAYVPMSTILEALEGVLTEEERQALLTKLIGVRSGGVAPGDLITAELFNAVLSDINGLKIRLARIEGVAGAPILRRVVPDGGTIEVGTLITLVGSNFDPEPTKNRVHIGQTVIANFFNGSRTSLSFTLPSSIAPLPGVFDISVETEGRRSNALPISIVEEPRVQRGEFEIATIAVPDGVMLADKTMTFTWDVEAVTTLDDTLDLQLSVGGVSGASLAKWQEAARFQPPSPVSIAAGDKKRITAEIKAPRDAVAADLALRVTGIDGTTTATSETIAWRAGEPIESSDKLAAIEFSVPADNGTGTADLNDVPNLDIGGIAMHGIRVRRGATGFIEFEVTHSSDNSAQGDYEFSVSIEAEDSNWVVKQGPIPASSTGLPPGEDDDFVIELSNTAGASGSIAFLRVEARQTRTTTTLGQFKSFLVIPLELF